ncbi:pro-MCH [Paramisgurnus dabryanus]|uniref:pro-MCH n=1 Tax=Paramisgurnus dabryanus TaxID=90735 RepID=UPI0031F3583D
MASTCTVILAFALFLEFTTYRTMALPRGITDQESADQDRVISMTDDANEASPGLLSFKGYPIIEGRLADKDGTKRIFILADTEIKRSPGRETYPAFPQTLPLRGMDHTLDGFSMRDTRSADDVIPMGRRDIDLLRCMIGRVYRPCWKA